MPMTRSLLGRQFTYSEAKKEETINVLQELTYVAKAAAFRDHIGVKSPVIKAIVAHHLCLTSTTCQVHISDRSEWLNGSFNLCVPVSIRKPNQKSSRRMLIRFPLPFKVAGPDIGDEKIRCEAATYAWLNEECPDILTASLQGFGLSTGQRFTAIRNASLLTRCFQYFKRQILSLFRCSVPCQYMKHQASALDGLGVGYLLLDYVEDGKMLSHSYAERSHDTTLRRNLFNDLAKIQFTLSRKPLPRIGSLTINDDGVLGLNNRPLTLEICQLENENIPVEISRRTTYSTVDTYIHDVLSLHDNRLRYQPNGASSVKDCISQMSALTTMRSVYPDFFDRKLRSGPFVLTLTDLHASNFFVDDDWHITRLIDLEWACVRPIEMQHPPYWLTSQAVDRIDETQYSEICNEFIDAFEQVERNILDERSTAMIGCDFSYTELLKRLWKQGTFWYCFALDSPTGLHHIFYHRIRPRYQIPYGESEKSKFDDGFYITAPTFWCPKAWSFMISKAKEKEKYDERLLNAFRVDSP
ncbi:hypothetical protein EMCG_07022 [[Emmonsia] crescens]|uniref:Aminoglycoside phosphotransferase domain-containing protein n=1 Tax=[Emmonsia] crescens TaxID=73230 RepID=A0A0G2I9T5_9EURO|nr:hypothetical protein EMCG_07022 [Emmonsia crescens UAMH 3008]